MKLRLLIAGTVAALAATVLLFGGTFDGERAARAGALAGEAQVAAGYAELEAARVRVDPSRYPVAETHFREALTLGGADAAALRGLAALAAARHRFDDSLELAREAQRLAPADASVYGLIGDAALELGRYRQAIEAFDRMMALKPSPSGYARVSYARELLGDADGAVEAMRLSAEAAGRAEPTAWALVHLGNLHAGERALGYYRAALSRVPGYAPALGALADAAFARGELALAERLYLRALARVDDPGLAAGLGDVLAAMGRQDDAESYFRKAAELEALFAAHGGRNEVETAEFDLDHDRNLRDALARAREGARLRPGIEGTHVLAWALYKNGRCAEAVRPSNRALRLAPNDVGALLHRVLIERCLGNRDAARTFFARARTLDPTARMPSPYRLRPTIAAWQEERSSS